VRKLKQEIENLNLKLPTGNSAREYGKTSNMEKY